MKLGVIGTGISGMTAAWALAAENDLTVFEAAPRLGGHTHTVPVTHAGVTWPVDTGFIVFNPVHYPNFTRLLDHLGVASQPTVMSFSVACERSGLQYTGSGLTGLFLQRRNLFSVSHWAMVRDILRFHDRADKLRRDPDDLTVEQVVRREGFGEAFLNRYLVPLGASLWSCPASRFRRFPMRFVVEFLSNHCMMQVAGRPQWRVITGGSHRYVEKLTAPYRDRIQLACPVRSVTRHGDHVELVTAAGVVHRFDEVIFACHADTALTILGDADDVERDLLAAFPYQPNLALLHTDARLLPRDRRAWSSWNYRIGADSEHQATVTYNMNILQGFDAPVTFCVTLNGEGQVDPAKVLARIPYEHPLYTSRRDAAQRRHHEVIRRRRTSFCGAYWGYGFHEDGVRSALQVSEAFGAVAGFGAGGREAS